MIDLELSGCTVSRVEPNVNTVDLFFSDGSMLRVENVFTVTGPDGLVGEVVSTEPGSVTPVLGLLGAEVSSAVAGADGGLDLTFAHGRRMHVDPDPAYEAWSFGGGAHRGLLSGPGGVI